MQHSAATPRPRVLYYCPPSSAPTAEEDVVAPLRDLADIVVCPTPASVWAQIDSSACGPTGRRMLKRMYQPQSLADVLIQDRAELPTCNPHSAEHEGSGHTPQQRLPPDVGMYTVVAVIAKAGTKGEASGVDLLAKIAERGRQEVDAEKAHRQRLGRDRDRGAGTAHTDVKGQRIVASSADIVDFGPDVFASCAHIFLALFSWTLARNPALRLSSADDGIHMVSDAPNDLRVAIERTVYLRPVAFNSPVLTGQAAAAAPPPPPGSNTRDDRLDDETERTNRLDRGASCYRCPYCLLGNLSHVDLILHMPLFHINAKNIRAECQFCTPFPGMCGVTLSSYGEPKNPSNIAVHIIEGHTVNIMGGENAVSIALASKVSRNVFKTVFDGGHSHSFMNSLLGIKFPDFVPGAASARDVVKDIKASKICDERERDATWREYDAEAQRVAEMSEIDQFVRWRKMTRRLASAAILEPEQPIECHDKVLFGPNGERLLPKPTYRAVSGGSGVPIPPSHPRHTGRPDMALFAFALVMVQRPSDKKFLLVQEFCSQGYWLPGGGIDAGEFPIKGAQRECLEEAGVDVDITGLLRVEYSARKDSQHSGHVRTRYIFYGQPKDGSDARAKTIPDYESAGAVWVSAEEIVSGQLRLRGPEPKEWAQYLMDGGAVFPADILGKEGSAPPQRPH